MQVKKGVFPAPFFTLAVAGKLLSSRRSITKFNAATVLPLLATSALGCGFGRSMRRVDEIVPPVFRSLAVYGEMRNGLS
jgi:hypothetical protein